MNYKNKSYSIVIDHVGLQDQLNEFYDTLPDNEEVISVVTVGDSKLVITTRILAETKNRNLLLEEVKIRYEKG